MNMKLLLESFKSYTQELLSEIKMEQVLPRFESKAFIKAAEGFAGYLGDEGEFKGLNPQQKMGLLLQKDALPQDIEEKYKPEALNWLISYFIKYPDQLVSYIQDVRRSLETFYQIKQVKMDRILSKNSIHDIDGSELFSVVDEAEADWYEYNQSKADKNYQAGTNKIYEDEDWEVYIPENKGAACKLGKGTEWCTAAPGLDYYKKYHSPEDPLIIFISKQDPTEKYQFHYGTRQCMNKKDVQLDEAADGGKYFQLHSIVANSDKVPEDIKQQAKRYAKGYQKLPDGGYKLKFVHKSLLHDEYYDENGNLNREDGPAVILYNNKGNVDTEMWYRHNLLYRKGEPALIYYSEDTGEPYWKVWYEGGGGLKHRNDGPASVREFTPMAVDDEGEWQPAGEKTVDAEYFWQGRSVPKKEYERLKSEYEQRNNSLQEMIKEEIAKVLQEKWSAKYKKSINCKNPKGFSQRAHCQGKKKKGK